MPEEDDKSADAGSEDEASGPVGGERLAAARREQQITVVEIAKELHLDEPKVRALERNEFDVLGAPVFAKGHLRKYSQLVGVDENDVFADYYQLTRTEKLPPIIVGRKKARRELSPGPWIAASIVIAAAAIAYWWFGVREPAPPVSEPAPVEEMPTESDLDNPADDEPVLLATAEEEALPEPAADTAAAVVEAAPEPAAIADDEIRLELQFSGDCWAEISDANGRRLFFNMGRAGRNLALTGPAPFTVLLGNADNVTLQVNGSPYAIPAAARSNRTARLTILQPAS